MHENFVIVDSVEYVYRRNRYGFGATLRHVRRKLAALKLYFFLTLLCAGAGAAVTFFSDVKPPMPAVEDDLMGKLQNLPTDQKRDLMEKYQSGDMGDMMEKYKEMVK